MRLFDFFSIFEKFQLKSNFSENVRPNIFHHLKSFDFIFIAENFYKFRNFLSDLEIAETFENVEGIVLVRKTNVRNFFTH